MGISGGSNPGLLPWQQLLGESELLSTCKSLQIQGRGVHHGEQRRLWWAGHPLLRRLETSLLGTGQHCSLPSLPPWGLVVLLLASSIIYRSFSHRQRRADSLPPSPWRTQTSGVFRRVFSVSSHQKVTVSTIFRNKGKLGMFQDPETMHLKLKSCIRI